MFKIVKTVADTHLTLTSDSTDGVSKNGQMFPRCYFCNFIWCHWNDTAALMLLCLINVSVFNSFCPHRGQNPGHTPRAAARRGPRPRVTAAQLRAIDNLIRAVGGRGTPAPNVCPRNTNGAVSTLLSADLRADRQTRRSQTEMLKSRRFIWPLAGFGWEIEPAIASVITQSARPLTVMRH